MNKPGSITGIPETTTIAFQHQWKKDKPGESHLIAFLPTSNGRLAVFPHFDWEPIENYEYLCVLFPIKNAAIAAPVGGIPETERKKE